MRREAARRAERGLPPRVPMNKRKGWRARIGWFLRCTADRLDYDGAMRAFAGKPQELWLPSAPQPPLVVTEEPNRPQPRLDADLGGGMAIMIGRVRECPVLHAKFVALGHNTIRGAAGAASLNAELMHVEGLLG